MSQTHQPYSVLMSVYCAEKADHLMLALNSILNQTVSPDEIFIVEDGPLPATLQTIIEDQRRQNPALYTILALPENKGLGPALAAGLPKCRNEVIARMDSDDYSYPARMENELTLMEANDLDMVGTQVTEFVISPDRPIARTDLPVTDSDIRKYSHRRNPFRHPSIVYKRSSVLAAGNYSSDYPFFEDWELFNRLLDNRNRAANVNQVLVAMRVSKDFYARRGGRRYMRDMLHFKYDQWRKGYFSLADFCLTALPHAAVCLIPNTLRSYIYSHALRKRQDNA